MLPKRVAAWLTLASGLPFCASSQIDEDELGAWYTYAWNATFDERSIGFQGDVQYRNWDVVGDLEQLLLRAGVTFRINESRALYTAGAAHITSGTYGDSSATTAERRLYQERPPRHEYFLTEKGLDLWPTMVAMLEFGDRHLSDEGPPMVLRHKECGGRVNGRGICERCDQVLTARDARAEDGPGMPAEFRKAA